MLDQIDRNILRRLQANGRVTNQALAQACNLSPAACFDRVKRLRASGYILATMTILDPVKLDRALLIFIEVQLDRTVPELFAAFREAVHAQPEILECHMVAGRFDYLIKARVKDMAAYRVFLGDILDQMPGVRETRTYAVLEEVKNSLALPV